MVASWDWTQISMIQREREGLHYRQRSIRSPRRQIRKLRRLQRDPLLVRSLPSFAPSTFFRWRTCSRSCWPTFLHSSAYGRVHGGLHRPSSAHPSVQELLKSVHCWISCGSLDAQSLGTNKFSLCVTSSVDIADMETPEKGEYELRRDARVRELQEWFGPIKQAAAAL